MGDVSRADVFDPSEVAICLVFARVGGKRWGHHIFVGGLDFLNSDLSRLSTLKACEIEKQFPGLLRRIGMRQHGCFFRMLIRFFGSC